MPVTRPMQSQFSAGSGFASIPVLFSLPNVQPAIAAASTVTHTLDNPANTGGGARTGSLAGVSTPVTLGATPENQGAEGFETSSIVVSPTSAVAARADSWLSKLSSQLTNITIVILLLAVVGLAFRNQQQGQSIKTSTDETSLSQVETVATPKEVDRIPAPPVERVAVLPTPPKTVEERQPTSNTPQVAIDEPVEEPSPQEQLTIPLLLPKSMDPPSATAATSTASKSSSDQQPAASSGPYGSAPSPFSLTSSKSGSTVPASSAKSEAIDTDTPSLNTKDIILLRNGQRRVENSSSDSGLPKVESMSRRNASSTPTVRNGGPIMTGQSYPPVARQYEPISMPPAPSRITQPSASNAGASPAGSSPTPYVPLSPVLPNPVPSQGLDSGNP